MSSTGGIFQIVTNEGRNDRFIMATRLLQDRIEQIETEATRNRANLVIFDVRVARIVRGNNGTQ